MTTGPRILDEVLTPLLNDLSSPSHRSEVALDGLKQVPTLPILLSLSLYQV